MRYDHFTMLPEQAFRKLGHKLQTLEGGGKGSKAPETPDYTAAANATAQGNLEAARAAAAANRVNQVTPYGNLTWTQDKKTSFDQSGYDAAMAQYKKDLAAYNKKSASLAKGGALDSFGLSPGGLPSKLKAPVAPTKAQFTKVSNPDGGWKATTTLSEAEQSKLDKTNALTSSLLDTASQGLGYVDDALSTGGRLNEDSLAQMPIQGESVQAAIMSRLQPQLAQQQESLRSRLAAQGISEGSEAYTNAMREQGQKENDLYTQAALQGIQTGLTARQQGIQEQYTSQDRPLNIVNALRTGAQVQAPTFAAVPQQQTTAGADLLGATQATYNADLSAANAKNAAASSTMGTIGTIGGAAITAF